MVGYNISLQLQAITVFISASGGHRFLAEFLEVGGVLTVLELLGLPQIREVKTKIIPLVKILSLNSTSLNLSSSPQPDRAEAMRLLINIATAGRSYREFICESYGIRAVADCLARTTSDIVADYAKNLLFQLGTVKIDVNAGRVGALYLKSPKLLLLG